MDLSKTMYVINKIILLTKGVRKKQYLTGLF